MRTGDLSAPAAGVLVAILIALGLILAACTEGAPKAGVDQRAIDRNAVEATAVNPTVVDPRAIEPEVAGEKRGSSRVLEVSVGPARRECYGPFRRMCLIVDGGFFYEEIERFTHEPGYEYRLRIERYDAFPGQKEPPQDAGRYGYRLVEVLSKTRAAGSITEVTVAPTRVQCPKSEERCLLVDGRPVRDSVDGFDFQPGFEYRVRLERYGDGTRRLVAIVDQIPAQHVAEEITVGPWRVGCYEDAPITAACIVVNGEPYHGVIEEFPRGHGFEYRLRVEKYDLFTGDAEPPPELPEYGYRLISVLSEMPASNPPSSN